MKLTKRMTALVFCVMLVLGLMMSCAMADGGYVLLKRIMATDLSSTVKAPECLDITDKLDISEGMELICFINIPNNWIAFQGKNEQEKTTVLDYMSLTDKQLWGYGYEILNNYDKITAAMTTHKTFYIYITYGDEDDDSLLVTSSDMAKQCADIFAGAD